ncbi:CbrC family protein [Micromonospora sp. NPDC005806]|uniref:CbrC family protein n=1 Tax=Micromonospora sp. NPDC005806 TaxID=3364234 RepID=UPI0036AB3A36
MLADEEGLPQFPYHPDPVGTGSIVAAEVVCACCGRRRPFTYVGPVYAVEELARALCPWCIANGTPRSRAIAARVHPRAARCATAS